MRSGIAFAMVLIFLLAVAVRPAMAAPAGFLQEISIPFVTTDHITYTFPEAFTTASILEFNSASRNDASLETFNVDFPLFSDGNGAGPAKGPLSLPGGASIGAGASSNVLPFGPVDLAFPSIAQTARESTACQRTYFFTDTFSV